MTPVGAHVVLLKIDFNVHSPGVSVQSQYGTHVVRMERRTSEMRSFFFWAGFWFRSRMETISLLLFFRGTGCLQEKMYW